MSSPSKKNGKQQILNPPKRYLGGRFSKERY